LEETTLDVQLPELPTELSAISEDRVRECVAKIIDGADSPLRYNATSVEVGLFQAAASNRGRASSSDESFPRDSAVPRARGRSSRH
jgi:hypothetical protein